jgi:hypothetical protein
MKNYLHKILHPISTAAQFLVSQNSKGKYESRKILGFVRKNEKEMFFLDFFISFVVSSTFCLF